MSARQSSLRSTTRQSRRAASRQPAGDGERPARGDTEIPSSARTRPSNWAILGPLACVALAVVFNLFLLRAEVRPVAPPNDTSVHVSMVRYAEDRILDGKLPFDGWYPRLSMGLPQFHHYQSLPAIISGAIATQFGAARTVAWSNYLLVCLLPLCIYWAVRLFRFDRWTAAIAALAVPLIHSVTLYGYEHGSFQWRGNGIWTALWGMWLLPFALAFSYRAVSRGKGYALAALFIGLTIMAHFLTGYLVLLSLGLWVVVKPSEWWRRIMRAAIVGLGSVLVAGWVVVPLLADSKWSNRTEYNVGTFWFDSAGGKKVMTWLVTGRVFDYQHWPVVTVLAGVGTVVCIARFRRDERARAVLGFTALSLLLFCGRDTIGFVMNRVPGGPDLLLHRYIMGVHLGGIVLAGVGGAWIARHVYSFTEKRLPRVPPVAIGAAILVIAVVAITPVWRERSHYDALNAAGIDSQQIFDANDGRDFTTLANTAKALGGGRLYAGSPGTAAEIGSVGANQYLLVDNADAVGFMLRTLSLSSDAETRFDATNPAHYDLFNVRYVIQPRTKPPVVPATLLGTEGRWGLWSVPTSGYLEVVDTTSAIIADRTNLGKRTAGFLSSTLPRERRIPTIAFGGDAAAPPTAAYGTPTGAAGVITSQYDRPEDGSFGGEIVANRSAVVMLKATYDPHWKVTVDGKPAKSQMLAPSLVGVGVSPGRHTIAFRYDSYHYYWLLFLLGGLTLAALALVPRYGRQWADLARRRLGR
jgi:hypothetical protein